MSNNKLKNKKRTLFLGSKKERDFVVENLSMLLGAGIPITQAIKIVQEGVKSKPLKNILNEMEQEIEAGTPLWRTFESSGLLPANMIFLVKIGESSGRLPENLKIVASQEQKNRSFKSKILAAMIYPMIVFGLTFFIGLGVAFFVLPKLAAVFKNMDVKLPLITKILIGAGNFMAQNIYAIMVFLVLFFVVTFFLFLIPRVRIFFSDLLFHFPRIKGLLKEVEIARMGYIMGTLLESGLPALDAISSLVDSTDSTMHKKIYRNIAKMIEEGNSFEKSLLKTKNVKKIIPSQIQQMIFAGEGSGNLSMVMLKINEIYEDKVDVSTKNIATVLEPLLLVVVWFGVLFIALAVIMPIYGLIGGIK